jgi:hypothetical protein
MTFETKEEYFKAMKEMMLDLRGDWSSNNVSRIETLRNLAQEFIENFNGPCPQVVDCLSQCNIELTDMDGFYDGRIFRDCCSLYEYGYPKGCTPEVHQWLTVNCNNFEKFSKLIEEG